MYNPPPEKPSTPNPLLVLIAVLAALWVWF